MVQMRGADLDALEKLILMKVEKDCQDKKAEEFKEFWPKTCYYLITIYAYCRYST